MTFREWLGSWRDWFRGVLFGMAAYDAVMMFRKHAPTWSICSC